MTEEFDVIVIGAGCAGAAAAIYAARQNLKTLLLDSAGFGGQLLWTDEIENYPGFLSIKGPELAKIMQEHVKKFKVETRIEKVEKIEDKKIKKVKTSSNEYNTKVIIFTTGAGHRHLDVPGEEELQGKGVSYCAVCDGNFFKAQDVAVIGGGATGLQYASYMENIANKVYLVHRRQGFRGEQILIEHIKKSDIELVLDSTITKILGKNKVTGIKVKNVKTSEEKTIDVAGVFIAVGFVPNSGLAKEIGVELNEHEYIKVDAKMHTNKPGIFAAGDLTGGLAQIATAVGQGAIAGIESYKYIKQQEVNK